MAAVVPQIFTPGFRLIDGSALNTALANNFVSSQDSMTANGTTKATGTQITTQIARFTTVGASGVAILPPATAGSEVGIVNAGANTLTIYPYAATDVIDGNSAGASTTLSTANRAAWFICTAASPGQWVSGLFGAVSS
jgi:hypothetical protein